MGEFAEASDRRHYLVLTYQGWGLCRPLISLTAQLLKINPLLRITILVPTGYASKVATEISHHRLSPAEREALHVIHYGENRAKAVGGHTLHEDKVDLAAIALGEFDRIFPSILRCEPVLDAAIHQLVPPFEITPSVIIADIVLSVSPEQAINPIIRRHLSQAQIGPVKILRSAPISAATFAWWYLKDTSAGPGIWKRIFERVRAGEDEATVFDEMVTRNDLKIDIPGCHPMHMYETEPNIPATDQYISRVFRTELDHVDGSIVNWPAYLSQEVVEGAKRQFRHFYAVSPFPDPDTASSTGDTPRHEALGFLDACLEKQGPQSTLFISFGTWYYPPTPHQTSLLLKTLTTLSIPYIFLPGVAPSQSRSIVLETISSNHQTAYTADWLPQTEILHHPAISAFLTHAGSNSVVESIGFGVPMVFWPGGIDQPIIANELSERGVGIELIQIRRGGHIGRSTAQGVMVDGSDEAIVNELETVLGDIKTGGEMIMRWRVNIERLRVALREDLKNGPSREALRELAGLGWEK